MKNTNGAQENSRETNSRNREIYEHSGQFSPISLVEEGKAEQYTFFGEVLKIITDVLKYAIPLAAVLILILIFFRIDKVELKNSEDFLPEQLECVENAYIGKNLLFSSKTGIINVIKENIPYASDIKITKQFPSTLGIKMSTEKGKYYVIIGSAYYILTEDYTVTAKTTRVEAIENGKYVKLESSKISKCVLGSKIQFRDVDMQGILEELVGLINEHDMGMYITGITLNSKFDIRFEYRGRFLIKLGDLYDLDEKMRRLDKIFETLDERESGTIDISDKDLEEAIITKNK